MSVRRFEVYLVNLDPTQGSEIKKTRPCLVVSPDEMNIFISTVIVAPMTTKGRNYPTRVSCEFQGKQGQIVLDQIRTIDKSRLVQKLGKIEKTTQTKVLAILAELFARRMRFTAVQLARIRGIKQKFLQLFLIKTSAHYAVLAITCVLSELSQLKLTVKRSYS